MNFDIQTFCLGLARWAMETCAMDGLRMAIVQPCPYAVDRSRRKPCSRLPVSRSMGKVLTNNQVSDYLYSTGKSICATYSNYRMSIYIYIYIWCVFLTIICVHIANANIKQNTIWIPKKTCAGMVVLDSICANKNVFTYIVTHTHI